MQILELLCYHLLLECVYRSVYRFVDFMRYPKLPYEAYCLLRNCLYRRHCLLNNIVQLLRKTVPTLPLQNIAKRASKKWLISQNKTQNHHHQHHHLVMNIIINQNLPIFDSFETGFAFVCSSTFLLKSDSGLVFALLESFSTWLFW